MIEGQISGKTRRNIVKILRVLKHAQKGGEDFLTINKIAKRSGIHKWSVSRIIDLYCPYISVRFIEELDALGLSAKMVQLEDPGITEEQALRCLDVRFSGRA